MALKTEVKLITLTDGVRKEVASMGEILYFNWNFCTYALLNKSQNLFTDCLSLGESRAIYKLGSGRTNIKGSGIMTQYRSNIYGLRDLAS